jgi:hypothetical protein
LTIQFAFRNQTLGLVALVASGINCAAATVEVWSVRDFGAKGDGASKDSTAIQSAIDKAAIAGGTVVIPPGKYISGTLHLRSNITLRIERGAILLFSPDDSDFDDYEGLPYHMRGSPQKERQVESVNLLPAERRRRQAPPAWDDTETTYFHYALLAGDGVRNVSIEGPGEINGNRTRRGGPKPIAFRKSESISVRNLTIRNAPNYNISLLGTDFVEVEGVTLINGFADGVDPDSSRFVRITNSYIDVFDDAVCPKASMALGKPRSTEHLVVANCILRTNCNHFKFGTETSGGLKNVSVSNCVMLKRDAGRAATAGIAIESVDGGNVDNVVISNISMEDVQAPVFIRLGSRGRGMDQPAAGSIKNISISNVIATGATLASSITAVEARRIENVSIEGLKVTAAGGGSVQDLDVPELPAEYPESTMFGPLPALGLYARHVEGLTLKGLSLHASSPDPRPAMVLDDVANVQMTGFDSSHIPVDGPVVIFRDVIGALLYGTRLSSAANVFLNVMGARSSSVVLRGNDLSLAREAVQTSSGAPGAAVRIDTAGSR